MSTLSSIGLIPSASGAGKSIIATAGSVPLTTTTNSTLLTMPNIPFGKYIVFYRNVFTGQTSTVITRLRLNTTTGDGSINPRDFIYSSTQLSSTTPFILEYSGAFTSKFGDTSLTLSVSNATAFTGGTLECTSTTIDLVKIA